jgi:L-fucose mutarotase
MIKQKLIHPIILSTLAASGHGSGILIADGNYPAITRANPAAQRVYLNLMPGIPTIPQVLEAIIATVPIEAAHAMVTDDGSEPPIHDEFRELLPGLDLILHKRSSFYDKTRDPDVSLVIATGEQRIFANILLIVGVVPAKIS